jgi:ElaB/YqjD/DUF883 family membrane-anchored ribosome-binding protein
MAEPTATASTPKANKNAEPLAEGGALNTGSGAAEARDRFGKAIEEAKAGAQAVRDEALSRAGEYRDKLKGTGTDWIDEAKSYGDQAKERATDFAVEGKAKTTEALRGLSKIVSDNATVIDEKLGLKYGDYARGAAQSIDGAATKLDGKDLAELGEDAREFVRKSPGLAIGVAAVAGFMLSRLFKGSDD